MFSQLEPVLVASDGPLPQRLFSGYALVGPDVIYGPDGFDDWCADHACDPFLHEDGCYLLVQQEGDDVVISADFQGYGKIFVYRDADRWAVSNSFARLVQAAKERGWPVQPNRHVLATWSQPWAFWQQLTTFETPARQISLLPRQDHLRVCDSALVQVRGSAPARVADPQAYVEALSTFIDVWLSRLHTCLTHGQTRLIVELTGGLDSRTVMALLLGLRDLGVDVDEAFTVLSTKNASRDFEIAQTIAEQFSLPFNQPLAPGELGETHLPSYRRWFDFSLGSYAPIYRPRAATVNGHLYVGGQGGGSQQLVWKFRTTYVMLLAVARRFGDVVTFARAARAFCRTNASLKAANPGLARLIAHYQEFRDRLHGGLHVQHTVRLQPLASKYLHAAAHHLDDAALARTQALYDIMAQLAPGLVDVPFDKASKERTPTHEAASPAAFDVTLTPGTLYGKLTTDVSAPAAPMWPQLRAAYAAAVARRDPRLVSKRVLESAEAAWAEIDAHGRLAHASHGAAIHQVILADLVSS